jgi:HPt (histidine-containing phosphotransfer) domain-containing protein
LGKEAQMLGKLAAIRQTFLQRTKGELALLLETLERVQAGDSSALVQLKSLAHRIHGSAAMFDFAAMSESAGQLEDLLEVLIGASAASALEPHDRCRVVECGRRLALEIGAASASAADS